MDNATTMGEVRPAKRRVKVHKYVNTLNKYAGKAVIVRGLGLCVQGFSISME